MSGPMISQVGRNDPALIQYAMQSFGTINLSEEDWKKAEDHYKVILTYIMKYINKINKICMDIIL
jgi:hypothetical protein